MQEEDQGLVEGVGEEAPHQMEEEGVHLLDFFFPDLACLVFLLVVGNWESLGVA